MEFRKLADEAYARALATENELREMKYREDEEYVREKLEAAGIEAVYKRGHAEVGDLVVSKHISFDIHGLELEGCCPHCFEKFKRQVWGDMDIYTVAGELYYEIDEHEAYCDGSQTLESPNYLRLAEMANDLEYGDNDGAIRSMAYSLIGILGILGEINSKNNKTGEIADL